MKNPTKFIDTTARHQAVCEASKQAADRRAARIKARAEAAERTAIAQAKLRHPSNWHK